MEGTLKLSSIRKKQFCDYCPTAGALSSQTPNNIRLSSRSASFSGRDRGLHEGFMLQRESEQRCPAKGFHSLFGDVMAHEIKDSIHSPSWQNSYTQAACLHGAVGGMGGYGGHVERLTVTQPVTLGRGGEVPDPSD